MEMTIALLYLMDQKSILRDKNLYDKYMQYHLLARTEICCAH